MNTFEVGSSAVIYIPSFINIGSGIQKLIGGYTQAHRQHDDLINLFLFSQNKKSRLKRNWVGIYGISTYFLMLAMSKILMSGVTTGAFSTKFAWYFVWQEPG
jgi:hypothetical protein